MKLIAILIAIFAANAAHAWDCNDPKNWSLNVPGNECYHKGPNPNAPKPVTTPGTSLSTSVANQTQSQGQSQTATGGKAIASGGAGGNATGGTGGSSQDSQRQSASASNTGNNSTYASNSYSTFQGSAPPVINPIRIVNCGIAVDAGASGVRGAGAFGVTVTTEECWNSNYAAMEEAAGRFYDACEMRRTSKTEQRAIKNGAKFSDCQPPAPIIEERIVKVGPTDEEIELIKQHAIAEYINSHPEKPCHPAPKGHKPKYLAPCKIAAREPQHQSVFGDADPMQPPR